MKKVTDCEECDEQDSNSGMPLREKIWSVLLQDKNILINGDIDEQLIEKAVMQIYIFNEIDDYNETQAVGYVRQPIKIFINSSGGLLDEAFSLISAIESSKTPVITIGLGKVMSAAFLILLSGHTRLAQRYSTLMYHQGSAGIIGEFNKMIEYAKHWENCQTIVEDYVIRQSKIKKKKLQEIFSHKQDWYMNASEAYDLGIIHGIYS